ncbi:hypothetical protein [Pontibacter vulgaris]|uniref:hypothetical protein n=1 Tax=Pontibacter vulgaris TaxID=2905679 RepID=UPI001FA6C5A7|nr:hypothetical protein [Pontibacter vulgaris]
MKKHNQELDIDEDLALEHKSLILERIGWILMLLFVVAAALGFTGRGGIINDKTEGSTAAGIEVAYERFLRRDAPSTLKITLHEPSSQVRFSKAFYEKVRIEEVVPEPKQVQVTHESILYTFEGAPVNASLLFYLKPQKAGSLQYMVDNGKHQLSISQYIYP